MTDIHLTDGVIRIMECDNGEIIIRIRGECYKKTNIVVENAGVPGIIGPDVDFNVANIVAEINGLAISQSQEGF